MKKIIGILVALGLVLSLTVMAMPVAAKVTQPQVVVYDTDCACSIGTYNITFNITASLTEGVHCICVKFPAGTTVPSTGSAWKDGDIMIYTGKPATLSVFGSEVTVSGTTVCFLPPADIVAADNSITVVFTSAAGIINPCTAGKYQLEVYTCREPDSTPVLSNKYTIVPCISDYDFGLDFGPTYPGISDDFVPPFKACGQNDTDQAYNTTYNTSMGVWFSSFNLTFGAAPVGCNPACSAVDLYMSLVAAPQFPCEVDPAANATMLLNGIWYHLTYNECVDDEPLEIKIGSISPLLANSTITMEGMLHFDTVGQYTICFWAECPGAIGAPCNPPSSEDPEVLVEKCYDFDVYQWKDAFRMELREKWNLISLPLVPLTDLSVEDALASIPAADLDTILSIWYYDRCEDEWLVWGNGQSSLKSLDDGNAYWVRVTYPITTPTCGNITWWTWGTPLPVPPASPAEYPVCEGWNMVGLTGWLTQSPSGYLWNWAGAPNPVVYGWTQGCWTAQGWDLLTWAAVAMNAGQGYWVAFPADGAVYVP